MIKVLWPRCFLLVVLVQTSWASIVWTQDRKMLAVGVDSESDHILGSEEVTKLLTRPECFGSPGDTSRPYIIKDYMIRSNGISLSAQLYLPSETGKWPLVILVPGGFNETEFIMQSLMSRQQELPKLIRPLRSAFPNAGAS